MTGAEVQRKCIFCLYDKPVSAFHPEHVFPEAIGGTLLAHMVCRDCNSKLGHGVDGPFVNLWFVQAKRALLAIGGKTGRIPNPFAQGVLAGDPQQKIRTVVDTEGIVEPHYVPNIRSETLPGGNERIQMTFDANDKAAIPDAINKMLRRRGLPGLPPESILEALKTQSITPTIEMAITIDLDVVRRELLKVAYELAADWLGAGYLDDPAASRLRSCILGNREQEAAFALRGTAHLGASAWGRDVTSHIAWMSVSGGRVGVYVRVFDLFEGIFEVSSNADRYTAVQEMFVAIDPPSGTLRLSTLEEELFRMTTEK